MEQPDGGRMMEEMMRSKGFEQKWSVYVLNSAEFAALPPFTLGMLRMAFYAGGIAATQTMLEVQHDMIEQVLDQLKPNK